MDKITQYREIIKRLITDYVNEAATRDDVERQMIFDTEHDHYQLVNVGWRNRHRVYGCVLHFDMSLDNAQSYCDSASCRLFAGSQIRKSGTEASRILRASLNKNKAKRDDSNN